MLKTEYKMEGLEAIQQKIDAIKATATDMAAGESERGVKFGLRKAANYIRDKVKEGAERVDDPNTPEKIAENVSTRWNGKESRKTGDLQFNVGIRGGAKSRDSNASNKGGDTYYWRFIEFGTATTPARPFIRPALKNGSQEAIRIFIENYKRSLDRSLKKVSK